MLEARQLTKYYGAARAVADISFCIQPGEVLGCLGPNGSGNAIRRSPSQVPLESSTIVEPVAIATRLIFSVSLCLLT
jgi:ABC-type phosphonate transport system ATPase subunit